MTKNIDSEDDDQGEATENECEDLVNVLQNVTLGFVKGMSEEEKIMIKHIIEIAEHNLDEEVNGFKKVDRNSLKDWNMKEMNEIKSDNITKINRSIKASVIFMERKVCLKLNQRTGNALKESW